jgi:SAM-dependent methyltransferase
VATTFLARSFRPTVGLDIAHGAVAEARSYARDRGTDPSFVVAEAPLLPFRSGSFSLIFDRGCLQAIPRGAWPRYFEEIRRLLGPKAVFELFCSKPLKRFPPMLSYRGIRARARWLLGRRGPQFLSHSLLIDMAGPSLEVLSLDDFSYRPATGPPRLMTHGVFRKS